LAATLTKLITQKTMNLMKMETFLIGFWIPEILFRFTRAEFFLECRQTFPR
jgi:hypothetical protein